MSEETIDPKTLERFSQEELKQMLGETIAEKLRKEEDRIKRYIDKAVDSLFDKDIVHRQTRIKESVIDERFKYLSFHYISTIVTDWLDENYSELKKRVYEYLNESYSSIEGKVSLSITAILNQQGEIFEIKPSYDVRKDDR